MATKPKPEMFLVKVADIQGLTEARFGKSDKVLKFGVSMTFREENGEQVFTGWKLAGADDGIEGVLFVGKNGRTFIADISRYPAKVASVMFFHGAKQKLGDEYADLDTVDDCFEAAIALDARLADGKWTVERAGYAGVSVLMRAIMKVFGKSEDEARAFLKDLKPDEKMALRKSPELAPTVEELEKEKAGKVDIAGKLAILKGLPAETPAA